MAGADEDCRIHDGVRDSKIRLDIPQKLHEKFGSFTSELNRSKDGNGGHEEVCYLSDYITSRIRMKIRFFNGTPGRFVEWVDAVEDFFVQMDIPEQLKCKIASYTLEGEAEHRWQQLQHHRTLRGMSKIYSWIKMKSLLLNEFPVELDNELKGISTCEATDKAHDLCFWRTTCSTKAPLQPVSNNQFQEKLIPYGLNHVTPKRGYIISSGAEVKLTNSATRKAIYNDEADSDLGSTGVPAIKIVLPSATIDAKQKVKGVEARIECNNSFDVHKTKVVVSERLDSLSK